MASEAYWCLIAIVLAALGMYFVLKPKLDSYKISIRSAFDDIVKLNNENKQLETLYQDKLKEVIKDSYYKANEGLNTEITPAKTEEKQIKVKKKASK